MTNLKLLCPYFNVIVYKIIKYWSLEQLEYTFKKLEFIKKYIGILIIAFLKQNKQIVYLVTTTN